jgi:hypothetical protein
MAVRNQSLGPLKQGHEITALSDSPTAAGSDEIIFVIQADTVLISLQASVVSGTLKVEVFTEGDKGAEVKTIEFPELSAPTSELLLRKASATMQKVIIRATYTGSCTYIVRARGTGTGEASFRILGSNNLTTSATTATTTAGAIVTAALTDRATVVIKNYNTTGTVFLGGTLAEASTTDGYPVGPQEAFVIDLAAGQEIYGITDSGSVDIRIAETGG